MPLFPNPEDVSPIDPRDREEAPVVATQPTTPEMKADIFRKLMASIEAQDAGPPQPPRQLSRAEKIGLAFSGAYGTPDRRAAIQQMVTERTPAYQEEQRREHLSRQTARYASMFGLLSEEERNEREIELAGEAAARADEKIGMERLRTEATVDRETRQRQAYDEGSELRALELDNERNQELRASAKNLREEILAKRATRDYNMGQNDRIITRENLKASKMRTFAVISTNVNRLKAMPDPYHRMMGMFIETDLENYMDQVTRVTNNEDPPTNVALNRIKLLRDHMETRIANAWDEESGMSKEERAAKEKGLDLSQATKDDLTAIGLSLARIEEANAILVTHPDIGGWFEGRQTYAAIEKAKGTEYAEDLATLTAIFSDLNSFFVFLRTGKQSNQNEMSQLEGILGQVTDNKIKVHAGIDQMHSFFLGKLNAIKILDGVSDDYANRLLDAIRNTSIQDYMNRPANAQPGNEDEDFIAYENLELGD